MSFAKAFGKSHGLSAELADEYAQFALMKKLCEGRKASYEQLLIDFKRGEFGDIRTAPGQAKAYGNYCRDEMGDDMATVDPPEDLAEETSYPITLTLKERGIATLLAEGVSQEDIAHFVLGVTPSRVCQMVRVIREKLADHEDLTHLRDMLDLEPHRHQLKVSWIKIYETLD